MDLLTKKEKMIKIEIPGSAKIIAESLVCDYNGTLAEDGILIPRVFDLLKSLEDDMGIHIITADTFGKARKNLKGINCQMVILRKDNEQLQKAALLKKLGEKSVIAIGNGMNDTLMLKNAAIGIAVVQKEGAALEAVLNADIICNDIIDALSLVKNTLRITATLRK